MLSDLNMKNILIVNTRSSERKLVGMVMWGAWAVASYFKATIPESNVIYLDENNEDNFREKFEAALSDRDMVGFSVTSMQIKYTLPLVRYIREKYPQIKIILGGMHPTLFPDQDYGDFFDEVITHDLPKDYFDYALLPEKVKDVYRKKRGQVVTGFNCSYKCAFCVNSVRNCRYEGVPVERIIADIDYVVKEFNPPKIYFRDEDFFQDIDKARKVVDHIIARGYKFKWEVASRVTHFREDRINDELLEKLVKANCSQLRFGVESGSQRVLNFLKKNQTVKQIKFAVSECCRYGIDACCSILIGIPTETAAEREETYQLITDLSKMGDKVVILGPQLYRPYPGGLLYEEVKKYGMDLPDKFADWEDYYDKNPMGDVFDAKLNYPWLTIKENKTLPYVWVVAHYSLNYLKSNNWIKKIIGVIFWLHWRTRWFYAPDVRVFMFIRKKFLKADFD